jgi:hypothetical protein
MTRFKFLGFLLPLAMAGGLALGLLATPAQAHHCKGNHPTDPPCDSDDTSPDAVEPALLTMGLPLAPYTGDPAGAMSTTELDVRVRQDSGRRLLFGISDFGEPGIQVHVEIERDVDGVPTNCAFDPEFNTDNSVEPMLEDLLDELETADITIGSLIVSINRKKFEIEDFVITYHTPDPVASDLPEGTIRIFFFNIGPNGRDPILVFGQVEFPGMFVITGPVAIQWSAENVNGPFNSKVVVCHSQVVTVQLTAP